MGPGDGNPLSCALQQSTAPRRWETQCLPVSLQMPSALKVQAVGALGESGIPVQVSMGTAAAVMF